MHHFIIRTIGKPHEQWQEAAIEQYKERLRPFAKLEIIELTEGHAGSAQADEQKTRTKEAESLLKSIPSNAILIALDEHGTNDSSERFAERMETWGSNGNPIVFFIGGSWGLDETLRKRATHIISFGKHTLPHILCRILLLEQLYRGEMILSGRTYHK